MSEGLVLPQSPLPTPKQVFYPSTTLELRGLVQGHLKSLFGLIPTPPFVCWLSAIDAAPVTLE